MNVLDVPMSHDQRAQRAIRAMRKGEQRSVKMSGELGATVDLWFGTLGCWASARIEVLFAWYCSTFIKVLDVP